MMVDFYRVYTNASANNADSSRANGSPFSAALNAARGTVIGNSANPKCEAGNGANPSPKPGNDANPTVKKDKSAKPDVKKEKNTNPPDKKDKTASPPADQSPQKPVSILASNANACKALSSMLGASISNYVDVDQSGSLNEGDRVGNTTLTTPMIYEATMRGRILDTADSIGAGWSFSSGGLGRVNGSSPFWQNNQFGSITMNPGMKPADALNDIFNNASRYSFDCASAVTLVNQKARLDTIGADNFNKLYPDGFYIAGWQDNSGTGFSLQASGRQTTRDGEMSHNGQSLLKGEFLPFDPAKGDRLVIGGTYYFENPGNNYNEAQGWNVIYLGQDANGQAKFWVIGGAVTSSLDASNNYASNRFVGEFLTSCISAPDGALLAAQDNGRALNIG